jgi:transposase
MITALAAESRGLCLFASARSKERSVGQGARTSVMRLSVAQLSALLEGLDWRLVHEAPEIVAPTLAG